jgi:hypothetical protein
MTSFGAVLTGGVLLLAAQIERATAPNGAEVHASLRAAAECMESALRGMPGVSNLEISVSTENGPPVPVIAYNFADSSGRRRYTELTLFEIPGAQEPFIFDIGDIRADPVAERLVPVWKARCHATYGYITSRPG